MSNGQLKTYRELKNEYDDGIKKLGSLSKHERENTAEGIKLIKRLKVLRKELDDRRLDRTNWTNQ